VQKLHLVGFTTDHRALILSVRRGARTGGYVLELDDAVTASVADALARRAAALEAEPAAEPTPLPQPVERPESALTVRQLQSRLRAGRTIEDVAAEAGVEPEWVARFAPPVVAEQGRVIEATKAARLERSRLGASGLPLGAAVYRNLVERGVRTTADELDRGWSARQGADGRWLVTLTYISRGRRQQPTWELAGARGPIRADDRLAAELAFVAPDPTLSSPKPGKPPKVPVTAPTEGDREAARRVSVARKVAEAQLAEAVSASTRRDAEVARRGPTAKNAAPTAAPSPVARSRPAAAKAAAPAPATPAEKPAVKAAAKRTSTKPPTETAVARKAPPKKKASAAKKAPAKKAPAAKSAVRKAPAANAAAKRPSSEKAPTEQAAMTKAPAKEAATAAVRKAPAEQAATAAAAAETKAAATNALPPTAGAAAPPPATDVAADVARARAEAQAELDAFVARQAATASAAMATRAGRPVFRSDLAVPAGRNGDTGTPEAPAGGAATAPPRPRRRDEPLRAR
jgi:hypothetical protein